YEAACFEGLGDALRRLQRYSDAKTAYENSVRALEGLKQNDPQVVIKLYQLADAFEEMGDYDRAETLYQRVLSAVEKGHGPNDPYVADILDDLGSTSFERDNYLGARSLYERALGIREMASPRDSRKVGQSLSNVGRALSREGDLRQAKSYYE